MDAGKGDEVKGDELHDSPEPDYLKACTRFGRVSHGGAVAIYK